MSTSQTISDKMVSKWVRKVDDRMNDRPNLGNTDSTGKNAKEAKMADCRQSVGSDEEKVCDHYHA